VPPVLKSLRCMNYYNYFTEVEEHFVRRRGKHLLVSPLDWSLIASWRASGVPLNVALRGIDIAVDGYLARHRPGEKLSTLAYCHDAVMQEYASHLESHLGEATPSGQQESETKASSPVPDGPDKNTVLALIFSRIREIKAAREKQSRLENCEAIDRVLSRLEEISRGVESDREVDFEALERDLDIVDETFVEGLQPAIPAEHLASWEQEAKKDLKIYKKRLPKDVFEKIRRNYMRQKVHKAFRVGELSVFHL